MKIIETFTLSKTGLPEDNEDAFWVGEDFCLVADGVTDKTKRRFHGKTGGQVAVECIVSVLRELSGDEDAHAVFDKVQARVRQFKNADEDLPIQASVVIYSRRHRELWSVGDCRYLINGELYQNEKKIDRLLSSLRAMIIEVLIRRGHTEEELLEHDISRDMIMPFLKMQSDFIGCSSDYGYCVIDGNRDDLDIKIHKIPGGSELVLASDGYPVLENTLAESEARLEALLRDDPLCYRLCPSTKGKSGNNISFDDRTYVKIITAP